jgi:hypothetical protein
MSFPDIETGYIQPSNTNQSYIKPVNIPIPETRIGHVQQTVIVDGNRIYIQRSGNDTLLGFCLGFLCLGGLPCIICVDDKGSYLTGWFISFLIVTILLLVYIALSVLLI